MWVRPSSAFYGVFSLDMDRSPGFGSAPADSFALFRPGFPPAPGLWPLTLPADAARRTVLQKVRGPPFDGVPQLVNTGFQVLFHSPPGVLFTFPSQYSALSVTGQYSALRGGPRSFHQGFPCPDVLWIPPWPFTLPLTGLSPSPAGFPKTVLLELLAFLAVRTPWRTRHGLGSAGFARRYSRHRCFFLFLRLLRCFSSPGSPPCAMDSRRDTQALPVWVPPFRYLRIDGYLPLPAAFRSLSRLSSAPSAKASTLCSFLLDLTLHSVAALPFFKKAFVALFFVYFVFVSRCLDI